MCALGQSDLRYMILIAIIVMNKNISFLLGARQLQCLASLRGLIRSLYIADFVTRVSTWAK